MAIRKEKGNVHESLVLCNSIVGELRQMSTVSEVKGIMDKIKAITIYFSQQNQSFDIQIRAAETYLIAMRRMGQILFEMAESGERETRGGDRTSNLSKGAVKTLEDMGISKRLSSECQRVYSIPENLFFEKIDESKRTPKPPTKATLLSLADKIEGKPKQTRKKEESKSEPSIDKKDEKDESMFDEVIEEVEFESTVLLNEIEDPASVLLDSLNALIDYEKTVGIEVFNRELSETPGIVNTISFFIRALSPVIQEAIDILLEPQD